MYYRIQRIALDTAALLGDHHVSRVWCGDVTIRCSECAGRGVVQTGYDSEERCGECDGRGELDDVRRGVSVCRSIEDLAAYFGARSAELDGCHIVELDGDESDDEDYDDGAPGRPLLVHPTAIIATHPLSVLE